MRAHVGVALVSVDSPRTPRAGAVLELRTRVDARGASALARDELPVAPAATSW